MTVILEAAKLYTSKGWVVHPLSKPEGDIKRSPGKRPLLKKWEQLEKTPDLSKFPAGCNIGLVCGKVSGVTIIDGDSPLFMQEVFNGMEDNLGTLRSRRTEGRGHTYFKYNPRLPASKHHILGLEILSDGSNAVLPPSVHISGDIYSWVNPKTSELREMPKKIEDNLIGLFKREADLKQMVGKCRHCFRDVLTRSPKPDMHGSDGREYMLAVSTDLKSKGATEDHALMFAKLMYGVGFDVEKTLVEWRNIDARKTWTCDVLRATLPSYIDPEQCEKCARRKEKYAGEHSQDTEAIKYIPVIGEYHWTDLGNAQRLKDMYGGEFRFCHPTNTWLVWDNTRWNTDKEAYLEQTAARGIIQQIYKEAVNVSDFEKKKEFIKFALKCESAQKIRSMLELAKSEPGIPILPEALDKDTMLFNVQNGTVDLRTGTLRPHTKTDFISKISPVVYDPDARCPRWIKFLDETFDKKKDLIEYMQRKSGYILTGETSEEDLDQLYGTGDNGKSKYVNQISHVMGEYQVKANIETIQATSNRTTANAASSDVARLKGARLVTVSEPERGTLLNEQRVKDWTGRDPITARHLYQEPITFLPEFKLWIYTNYKLRIKGTDNGIWRRVKLVPYEVTVAEELKDTHLDRKLLAESSGILNWMIAGCLKWQKDGLKVPTEILEATQEYREEQDYLAEFFSQCCEIGKTFDCQFAEIYYIYKIYCRINDMPAQGTRSFADTLGSKKFKKVPKEKGKFYLGFKMQLEIHEKYNKLKTDAASMETDGMTLMTHFLRSFLSNISHEKEIKKSVIPVIPSGKTPPNGDNLEQSKDAKITGYSVTEMDKKLIKYGGFYQNHHGSINSTNLEDFCISFRTTNKESSDKMYALSDVKKCASKLFKLTPVAVIEE